MPRAILSTIGLSLALAALQAPLVQAAPAPAAAEQNLPSPARGKVIYNAYILGPGDSLQVELLDLPELSGVFTIGPDGTIYLPRLRALYVEGLTVEELRYFLTEQFRAYVKSPQVYVRPVGYRPIRIYVSGEVRRPGYYTLSGVQNPASEITETNGSPTVAAGSAALGQATSSQTTSLSGGSSSTTLFPTVFDAIRTAQGITP